MSLFRKRHDRVYLDYASLAPRDERLFEHSKKLPAMGNASAFHKEGVMARAQLEGARARVAATLSAHPDEIVFTSGGTEGDNLALLGALESWVGMSKPHVIISEIEHAAIIETVKYLESRRKCVVSYLPVDERGVIDSATLSSLLRPETVLVATMIVNNELGTIAEVRDVAKCIREYKKETGTDGHYPLLLVDACQAPSYLDIDTRSLHADLIVLNGGKVYAGAGIGALYIKRGTPIASVYRGGDQEHGLRPGTEDALRAHDFSLALAECARIRPTEVARLTHLRDAFVKGLETLSKENGRKIDVLSDPEVSVPGIVNVFFENFGSELMVIELDAKGIAVSSKSACKSDSDEISHVIAALHKNIPPAIGTVRFSFGRWTTTKDIDRTISALREIFLKYKK